MNYQELIERLRSFEIDHEPDDWLVVRMRKISAMCDAIESLLAENERLNHNLTSTKQTMREYQELAAKRLEEIAKYRDSPVVAWQWLDTANFRSKLPKNADRSEWNQLIVKPGK